MCRYCAVLVVHNYWFNLNCWLWDFFSFSWPDSLHVIRIVVPHYSHKIYHSWLCFKNIYVLKWILLNKKKNEYSWVSLTISEKKKHLDYNVLCIDVFFKWIKWKNSCHVYIYEKYSLFFFGETFELNHFLLTKRWKFLYLFSSSLSSCYLL